MRENYAVMDGWKGASMRHFACGKLLLPLFCVMIAAFGMPAQRVLAAVIQVDDTCSLHDAIIAATTTGQLAAARRATVATIFISAETSH